jgi:hypothetical protein
MAITPKTEEQEVLKSLLGAYPGFLSEKLDWKPGPDPPDFIATSVQRKRYGLELTEWLDESQTTLSVSNEASRMALLKLIDSEHADCPSPLISLQICDRLDVPFQSRDRNKYVREIYQFAADHAPRWESWNPTGSWPVVELDAYPTLAKYCQCITLYGPPRASTTLSGLALYGPSKKWIEFEPIGGAYNPQWSVNALLSRIIAKTAKYGDLHRSQNLSHFALLAHYGIRGIMHNTPYKGSNSTLEDAAMQAHRCLLRDHGAFDSAYLYMNFNGGKLIKLFPEIATLKEFSHQSGEH